MKRCLNLTSAFLLSLLTAQVACAMEPGEYEGNGENGDGLYVSVKGNSVSMEVGKPGCQGDTEGKLKKVGKGHWQLRPDLPGCVIDFRQKGTRIIVTEGANCFQLHGAMCSFHGTISKKKQ